MKNIALQQAREARPEVPFENGTSLEYALHMRKFENATASETIDSRERLLELTKWFKGAPERLISSYAMGRNDPDGNLQKAKSQLDMLFRHHRDSFTSTVRKITKGKQIGQNDYQAHLDIFAELVEAQAMVNATGNSTEFHRRDVIQDIINSRLDHLSTKFWTEDEKRFRETGKAFTFDDLLTEVQKWLVILGNKGINEKAKEGNNGQNNNNKGNRQTANVNASSGRGNGPVSTTTQGYAGKVGNSPAKLQSTDRCAVCESVHQTIDCNVLLGLSHEDRKAKIHEKGICFYCLKKGHTSKFCPHPRPICGICNRPNHNSVMHRGSSFRNPNSLPFQPISPTRPAANNPNFPTTAPPPHGPSVTPATAPPAASGI